jgi:hypothetical protein
MPRGVPALLLLLAVASSALAGPPEGPSARMVIDAVPELRAEVKRCEREVSRATTELEKNMWQGELAEARANLAEAEGCLETAATEWRKVIACRERAVSWWLRQTRLEPPRLEVLLGSIALPRCRLAEIERKPDVLLRGLPRVITYYDWRLETIDTLRQQGAYETKQTQEERELHRRLRKAILRLDSVRNKLGQGPAR